MRVPHEFLSEVRPGTFVRKDNRDWIVTEVHSTEAKPAVVCRPASES
jgi:hypothetical protein